MVQATQIPVIFTPLSFPCPALFCETSPSSGPREMECSKHRVVVDLLLNLKLLSSCPKDLYKRHSRVCTQEKWENTAHNTTVQERSQQRYSQEPNSGNGPKVYKWWMNKEDAVYPYTGTWFRHKKAWSADTCYRVGKPWTRHGEWKRSDTQDRVLHHSIWNV